MTCSKSRFNKTLLYDLSADVRLPMDCLRTGFGRMIADEEDGGDDDGGGGLGGCQEKKNINKN